MSETKGTASGPHRPLSTRAELDARMAARARPEPQASLAPGGWDETETHRRVREEGERRIAELRERLEASRSRIEHAYAFKSLEGRARADFGRGRR
ncbi:MAG: hypothetical protein CMF74_10030 [Maricaulis sp.]|nr:hypothetical protein [Maricaulis sp.]HAQ34941.1 hypothetical protein [Alphaproteobacteria bacterium]